MPPASDWFFGNRKEFYARARKNTAAMAAEMRGCSDEDARTTLAALDGDESFLLGTLPSGEEVRIAAREVGRHGMVWGSSGAGKSYGLVIITNGWSSGGARRLQLIDPKGETVLMKSLHVAADYLDLPDTELEAFAARFRVFDVTPDALTPNPPSIVKWALLAIDPTGNLIPVARPVGKQVFVNLDPLSTHAVLMVAESDAVIAPQPSGQACTPKQQMYELGLGILPPLSGAAVGADDILQFRQQDMNWEPAIYPAWDAANPRLARFLIMLPKIDPEAEELIVHYGDGTSQDRDFIGMGGSRYNGAWYAEHAYAEPGPKTVRVEVLKKRIGTHPNHPVTLTLKEDLQVQ